jgi:hypothetical protein
MTAIYRKFLSFICGFIVIVVVGILVMLISLYEGKISMEKYTKGNDYLILLIAYATSLVVVIGNGIIVYAIKYLTTLEKYSC